MSFPTTYLPSSKIIQSITRANPCVITTTTNHGYQGGLYVRLIIPEGDGMQPINNKQYLITVLTSNTFSIDENTTNFDSFTSSGSSQYAQVIPVGEEANTLSNAERNSETITPETTWISS